MKKIILKLITTFFLSSWMLSVIAADVNADTKEKTDLASIRDPFLPIDYVPVSESNQQQKAQVERLQSLIKWPKLKLQGITRSNDNRYIAILDKIGIIEEGDVISVQKDGIIYRWKIDKISDKGISRTQLSATETAKPLKKQQ